MGRFLSIAIIGFDSSPQGYARRGLGLRKPESLFLNRSIHAPYLRRLLCQTAAGQADELGLYAQLRYTGWN